MASEIHFPKEFIANYYPGPDQPEYIGCMDRRLVAANDRALGGVQYFRQIRAGRYGIGHGIALTMETTRPNSYINTRGNIAHFSQAVGIILGQRNVITTKHGPICAGIQYSLPIHEAVKNGANDEPMFENSRKFYPDLTANMYGRIVSAAGRLSAARRVPGPQEINTILSAEVPLLLHDPKTNTPIDTLQYPTPHAELTATDHDTIMMIADYGSDTYFVRDAAHAAGWGAYWTSMGALPVVRDSLPEHLAKKVDIVTWGSVEAVCLGAVATHFILDGEGENRHPYPIEAVNFY